QGRDAFGILLQYPDTTGGIADHAALAAAARAQGQIVAVGADLLALALVAPPGAWGADIVYGTAQRFGVPLGYGGPHAAYFATRDACRRMMPGGIVVVSRDARVKAAHALSLRRLGQHIRGGKATSNICTAQVLLANMAGFYAVY